MRDKRNPCPSSTRGLGGLCNGPCEDTSRDGVCQDGALSLCLMASPCPDQLLSWTLPCSCALVSAVLSGLLAVPSCLGSTVLGIPDYWSPHIWHLPRPGVVALMWWPWQWLSPRAAWDEGNQ